ncbi:probable pectate lyase P59 [Vigna unguiculata]|uniref:probable pectate lyase P59 n=1 Tax=Vigna unguiculata TaxID=3917 RepID=UPI0010166030|nr:probable pectate lyase P59 [Vigna unguiculata]
MESTKFSLLFFYVIFLAILPTLKANIGHFDHVWHRRMKEAREAAKKAYKPNPMKVTAEFNAQVTRSLKGSNSTRRDLKKKSSGCNPTNPIDQCWRCDKNWFENRKKLADCVMGFAHGTTGGKEGKIYVVTDNSDNELVNPKPGTLRYAVTRPEPLWITFARSMNIKLKAELMLTSNKTIDARGANVHIKDGAQITIQYVNNIIIHGLHVHDIKQAKGGLIRDSVTHYGVRGISDGDGISVFGSTHIWIDHVSMHNCSDGLIDVIAASTAVSITNCHFVRHNDVLLFGATDSFSGDKVMQVTLAFNHFGKGLVQRMPRCRWGFFHIVNNDYTHWLMYAVGGSQQPTIISQGNRFVAPEDINAKEVTKRTQATKEVWKDWNWRSEGDLFVNGAYFVESGKKVTATPKTDVIAQSAKSVAILTQDAGPIKCVVNKPC